MSDAKVFELGQTVYIADFGHHETFVTCPDCLGTKHVLVVLGDGTEVTIECGGCDPGGYEPSTGVIRQYIYEARFKEVTVTGITVTANGVEYELDNHGGGSYFTRAADKVFNTKEDAIAAAGEEKAKYEAEENKRLMAKTKDKRSWKWNASYHRRCISDLEKQLAYHRSKVTICTDNAKKYERFDDRGDSHE